MKSAREMLKQGRLLFDGAMGTLYAARYREGGSCEAAALTHPERIQALHREYIEAGAGAIKTDTFSLPCMEREEALPLARAAARLALETAGEQAAVFADLGPVPDEREDRAAEIWLALAEEFLTLGIRHFLLETLPGDRGVRDFAIRLKEAAPDSFLLVSFAVGSDGVTRKGESGAALLRGMGEIPQVDGTGFNCVCGPNHMLHLLEALPHLEKPLSVMPNAGYPTVVGRRTLFTGTPEYFGEKLAELAGKGALILGGCCGTTPRHIAMAAACLNRMGSMPEVRIDRQEAPKEEERPLPGYARKLQAGERIMAVELDPPKDDRLADFPEAAKRLTEAGADLITLADCPVGRPRADSSMLAGLLHREYGLEVLPHLTCRDRNLNAIKALLLGLSMQEVHQVLLVTGDPIPMEDRQEVRSVYNFNSRRLAEYITTLNRTTLRRPFRLFGALNVNAVNFDIQLRLAAEKEEKGVTGFLTQPVLSRRALENLQKAHETLQGSILAGIYPPVSQKNALFLANEIAGIRVDEDIIRLYEGKSREEGEALALELALRTGRDTKPFSDGWYLMTPFRRYALMENILKGLKQL